MKYILSLLLLFASCSTVVKDDQQINSKEAMQAPYVLMISLDGFRHDYVKKYKPPFLSKFAKEGASLKSLIPSFPTKTFPNHYTLVTGLYPGHHGIVANKFYAPDLKLSYSLGDRNSVINPAFYKGVPLWNLARQNEMLSATYFWPGSEAAIGGMLPNYWEVYNHGTPHEERIKKVLEWLRLPEAKRPHFLTLYFHDVDSAGHGHGPDSKEVSEAISHVDFSLSKLVSEIEKLNLPLNIIITSDHGMTATEREKSILLNQAFEDESHKEILSYFDREGSGPIIHFYYKGAESLRDKKVAALQEIFKRNFKLLKSYRLKDAPERFHLNENVRMGDLFVTAPMGVFIGFRGDRLIKGNHGYDNIEGMDMHGIFYAQGPAFKNNFKLESRPNVSVYPLIAHILGLRYENEIDGKLEDLKPLLRP